MSTHTRPTTRQESPAETATRPAFGADDAVDVPRGSRSSFDPGNTHRLPNTVDGENQYVG